MGISIGTSAQRSELRENWRALVVATVGTAAGMSSLPFYSLGSFINPITADTGWSLAQVSGVFLFTTIALAIVALVIGRAIDRLGARRVALVSIPGFAVVLALISQYRGPYGGFVGLFALLGVLGAGTSPILYTRALNRVFDAARGLALGIALGGIGVAAIVLPPLVSAIIEATDWRTAYLVLAALALAPWPLAAIWLRDEGGARVVSQPADTRGVDAAVALRRRTYWTVLVTFAVVAVAVGAIIVQLIPILEEQGVGTITAASVASVTGIGVIVGRVFVGALLDLLFAGWVAATLLAITALGFLLLLTGSTGLATVAALLAGLVLGAEVDLVAYFTARYFGMRAYGVLYGLAYAAFALGAGLGPRVAGSVFDATGSYDLVIVGASVLLAVSSALALTLPRFNGAASAAARSGG